MGEFSVRLKELRNEKGVKQREMAQYLGITDRGYQCYEQGKGFPDVSRLCTLADYFDVSLDYLMGRSESRQKLP